MANTYTQVYIHVVFAVEGRQSLSTTDEHRWTRMKLPQ
jgi:hypothetical protein